MNIVMENPKYTSFAGALLLIIPIALIVYEHLAQHNKHPSILKTLIPSIAIDSVELMNGKTLEEVKAKDLEKKKANSNILKKINIKASYPAENKRDEVEQKEKPEQFASIQKKEIKESTPAPEQNEIETSIGDNPTGDVELPNLRLEGELSEEMLSLLLKNDQAKIIVNGSYYYQIGEGDLWSGHFKKLSISDPYALSNRSIPLTPELVSKLDTRFQLSFFTTLDTQSTYRLYLTRSLNHRIVGEQEAAQMASKERIKETTFIMAIKSGQVTFTLKKQP